MELRLVVGYLLLFCLIAVLAGLALHFRRRKREEFKRRWGVQKPPYYRKWMR